MADTPPSEEESAELISAPSGSSGEVLITEEQAANRLARWWHREYQALVAEEEEAEQVLPQVRQAMATSEVEIDGVKVKVATAARTVTMAQTALYPASERAGYDKTKLAEIFYHAVKAHKDAKFETIDLKIEDPDKLDTTYNLAATIEQIRSMHIEFDMTNVMQLVIWDGKDPKTIKSTTIDLYTNYASVTPEQVALSNQFYATMIDDPEHIYSDNLKLTFTSFKNNADKKIALKNMERYSKYPIEQQGGPLFFKLMMDQIQDNSTATADYLVKLVDNLKLTDIDGEDVTVAVSKARAVHERLSNLKDENDKDKIPDDFIEKLLAMFQTSSVPQFNKLFEQLTMQKDLAEFGAGAQATKLTNKEIPSVLEFAEKQYNKLISTNEWLGVTAKANETAFLANLAQDPSKICFNCGETGHHADKCPKPKVESRTYFVYLASVVSLVIARPAWRRPSSEGQRSSALRTMVSHAQGT